MCALTHRMQRTAAARACRVVSIDDDVFALQMIGQGAAMSAPLGGIDSRADDHRTAFLDAPDIGVEVLEAERQLIGVEPLGAATELHALELGDDRLKAFDLVIAGVDQARHVAHQLVQKAHIGRQIVEIEPHAFRYHKSTIFSSISAVSEQCSEQFSARFAGLPLLLGTPPVDPLNQHRQPRRRQHYALAHLMHARPHEAAMLHPLGEQAQSAPVPEQDLDDARIAPPEREQVTREAVFPQHFLHHHRQPIDPLAHVGMTQCQMHLRAGRNHQHCRSPCTRTVTKRAFSVPSSASCARQRNSSAAAIPCLRATCETVT